MFSCYLADEWRGVEVKLSDFGSCVDELFGSLSSWNPTVIRWSMLDISGHDTWMHADTLTKTSHLSQYCLFLPVLMRV